MYQVDLKCYHQKIHQKKSFRYTTLKDATWLSFEVLTSQVCIPPRRISSAIPGYDELWYRFKLYLYSVLSFGMIYGKCIMTSNNIMPILSITLNKTTVAVRKCVRKPRNESKIGNLFVNAAQTKWTQYTGHQQWSWCLQEKVYTSIKTNISIFLESWANSVVSEKLWL